MFDYPLMKSTKTFYDKMEILPTATERQVRDAISGTKEKLLKKQKRLEIKKSAVFQTLPRLAEILKTIETVKNDAERREELKGLFEEKERLETKAEANEPAYKGLMQDIVAIERQINELNSMQLDNTEERRRYDKANPPCGLLKLSTFTSAVFSKQDTTLFLIRKEIDHFLREERGMDCYHPSDFTRVEFSGDFNYNSYLDKE